MNINQEKILKLAQEKDIYRMSLRKIAEEIGIESPEKNAQTVKYHMEQLKKKGLIYFDPKQKKQKVAQTKTFVVDNLLNIPIVGSANCGPAMELAQEDITGYLKISKRLFGSTNPDCLIAVRAVGESLNKANIGGEAVSSGDYLIVDCKRQPQNNDYVLSIIDGAANFKKFYKDIKKKEIRLISESTLDISPIMLHEEDINTSGYMVNGVVVRVVKN